MNSVPHKYRNVINPWLRVSEIESAVKFNEKMLAKLGLSPTEEAELLCHHIEWDWSKPK